MSDPANQPHAAFLTRLTLYLAAVGAGLFLLFDAVPLLLQGSEVAARSGEITHTLIEGIFDSSGKPPSMQLDSIGGRLAVLGVLVVFFVGAVLLMVPISWVYMYTHPETHRRTMVNALIILPICATATVWLIHDSLPLAFGVAALIAAIRFRIRLDNPLDGVYIFAAISVGLASGIGHLGVGYVMTCFLCFGATIMWITRYGKRPHHDEPVAATATATAAAPAQEPPTQAA